MAAATKGVEAPLGAGGATGAAGPAAAADPTAETRGQVISK